MKLEELWQQVEWQDTALATSQVVPSRVQSKHPVERLRRNYRLSTWLSALFLICFFAMLFFFHEWIVRSGIILMIGTYIYFFYLNYQAFRNLQSSFPADKSLHEALSYTHEFIRTNMRIQERFGLAVYPFAAASGMLMGLAAAGGEAGKFLNERFVLVMLVVVPLCLTPISWWVSRWLYRIAYQPCLDEIKRLIDDLEKTEA